MADANKQAFPAVSKFRARYCPLCNRSASMNPETGVFYNGVGIQHKADCPNHLANRKKD